MMFAFNLLNFVAPIVLSYFDERMCYTILLLFTFHLSQPYSVNFKIPVRSNLLGKTPFETQKELVID